MNSVSTQCTNDSNVELLVDGQIWNSSIHVLYQLNDENLSVGCRKCNTDGSPPKWFYSNQTQIQQCKNTYELPLCTQTNGSIELLSFSPFKKSLAGEYQCDSEMLINIELGKLLCVSTIMY